MFEQDRAPVTLNEIHKQAASRLRTDELAPPTQSQRGSLPLETYTDIMITGCGSSHQPALLALYTRGETSGRPIAAMFLRDRFIFLGTNSIAGSVTKKSSGPNPDGWK